MTTCVGNTRAQEVKLEDVLAVEFLKVPVSSCTAPALRWGRGAGTLVGMEMSGRLRRRWGIPWQCY